MPTKQHIVRLTRRERTELQRMLLNGGLAQYQDRTARILLLTDQGAAGPSFTDEDAAWSSDTSIRTVARIRQSYAERGLNAVLARRRSGCGVRRRRMLGARGMAKLRRLCRTRPPNGAERWSLRSLADELIKRKVVKSISHESVRRALQKLEDED